MDVTTIQVEINSLGRLGFCIQKNEHIFTARNIGTRRELVDVFYGWHKDGLGITLEELPPLFAQWSQMSPSVHQTICSWP